PVAQEDVGGQPVSGRIDPIVLGWSATLRIAMLPAGFIAAALFLLLIHGLAGGASKPAIAQVRDSGRAFIVLPSGRESLVSDSRPAGLDVFSYADVVERVAPSVVTIRSEKRVRPPRMHPFMDDP